MHEFSEDLKRMWKGMIEENNRYDFVFEKLEDENHEAGCPYCTNSNSFSRDECELIKPVFRYFNGLDDFKTHALVFHCPRNHRFVLEIEHDDFEWSDQ